MKPKLFFRIGKYGYLDVNDNMEIVLSNDNIKDSEHSILTEEQTKQFFLGLRNMYLANNDKFWE